RDFHVTGVQTCALPICVLGRLGARGLNRRTALFTFAIAHASKLVLLVASLKRRIVFGGLRTARKLRDLIVAYRIGDRSDRLLFRSEERRVGKGSRLGRG